jgi:hypothetical protein
MPMANDPRLVVAAFGGVLPIGELPIEHGRYLTFEYIGAADHLAEAKPGIARERGRFWTSTDAAIRYAPICTLTSENARSDRRILETRASTYLLGGRANDDRLRTPILRGMGRRRLPRLQRRRRRLVGDQQRGRGAHR